MGNWQSGRMGLGTPFRKLSQTLKALNFSPAARKPAMSDDGSSSQATAPAGLVLGCQLREARQRGAEISPQVGGLKRGGKSQEETELKTQSPQLGPLWHTFLSQ